MGVLLDPGAIMPKVARIGDVAADLCAYSFVLPGSGNGAEVLLEEHNAAVLQPHSSIRIGTGVHLALPAGYRATIEGRSGLAFHHKIDVAGSVIDQGYTGSINVILINNGSDTFKVKRGDRIAQVSIHRYWHPVFNPITELPVTERGSQGFGSTGLK